jgi:hypothetical protein
MKTLLSASSLLAFYHKSAAQLYYFNDIKSAVLSGNDRNARVFDLI